MTSKVSNAPHRIFVGFDPRQIVSYTALYVSIIEHASRPISITPLVIGQLPIKRVGLTPFTYSRFLVPWLCDYKGTAMFIDVDTLFLADPTDVWRHVSKKNAVHVVKGSVQFEWASMMLFNCGHADNRILTPEHIDDPVACKAPHLISRQAGGWTERIGEIPPEWNHLVGYDAPCADPKMIHYTQGVPAYEETARCEHADAWRRCLQLSASTLPWIDLMGSSVHTKRLPDGRIVPKLWEPEGGADGDSQGEGRIPPAVQEKEQRGPDA